MPGCVRYETFDVEDSATGKTPLSIAIAGVDDGAATHARHSLYSATTARWQLSVH